MTLQISTSRCDFVVVVDVYVDGLIDETIKTIQIVFVEPNGAFGGRNPS